MAVLVCGGAGYIGSHVVNELLKQNIETVIIDSLEYGHKDAIKDCKNFYHGNIGDSDLLDKIFKSHDIDSVMHLCAYIEVGESVQNPAKYYYNNVSNSINLLNAMLKAKVKNFIFSSTAAVYGEPEKIPLEEDCRKEPTNPYGDSKLALEKILSWYSKAYDFNYVALRYFNASGAHPDGHIGEDHKPESHLIPLILQVPLGKRDSIKIFGDDYPTPDGTCLRDYIHVCDLALAHIAAMNYLKNGGKSVSCNLGNGNGFSVKEVIEVARKVTGHPIPAEVCPRRAGDSSELIASSKRAKEVLGWTPTIDSLETIVQTAWNWHKNHPNGYNDR
ncbi:UDP-glucose 4-epimerase GalE [Brachyspira hampsonii]|uniref:UDP-glucose 4-epimerase n=1 Tax=Brachyspira hampsonii TaxID=1287055 RepID=A0AAC9XJV3_9SPIR|nr:UDP-glucose 4-epimerase GalE [Brachyspira hampsonii]ASJ21192.1 UDP-glucose 4-epimerase GalE [Brachyspira hampsonii]ELV06590.1 UDP-glucose 4-epimerase [Brachyspira hampsonii 30599]MBW5379719.1 UDP-glucose 4-epimerase GalE [Brachyspira hampsonii]MBW5410262.1 UDP-glucose 4-epimerase GalE [Brachyspira hampsonii]OEJ17539.1 UDP-glucose 4-epimerase GalE [Brachyspira hampsonii]